MRIDDGAEFRRRLEARQQRRGGTRRHGKHHDIVGRKRDRVVAEFQFTDMVTVHRELAQLVPELDGGALVLQQLDRGLDQHRTQAVAGDQRPAGLSTRQQRFADDRAGQPRRTFGRIDIKCRQQQRLHQPLVQRALAGDRLADQFVGPCPDQRHQCEIIAQARVGNAARLVEHPERQPSVAEIELPAPAGRDVDEGKLRALRPDQPRLGADRARIGQRMAVTGQQQMIAVVDHQIGGGVKIRTATTAGGLRGLVDAHFVIGVRQPDGGGEAGNAGADDVSGFWHQMIE